MPRKKKGDPTIKPIKRYDYETPQDLFDELWDEVGGFDVDPCCLPDHYTAQRVLKAGGRIFIPPDTRLVTTGGRRTTRNMIKQQIRFDGLTHPWTNARDEPGKVYMNPPYGLALREWVPRAVEQVAAGYSEFVVGLLPSKTDTAWWHGYIMARWRLLRLGQTEHDTHPLLKDVRFVRSRLQFEGEKGPARPGTRTRWSSGRSKSTLERKEVFR